MLLNGHFHVPEAEDCGGFVYINDGSVSIPKQNSPHSYVVMENRTFVFKDLESGAVFRCFTVD